MLDLLYIHVLSITNTSLQRENGWTLLTSGLGGEEEGRVDNDAKICRTEEKLY